MAKDTETLYHEIKSAADIDAHLKENNTSFLDISFSDYINSLLKQKNMTIAEVQRKGRLTNYVYEIFNGTKMPMRNTAIQLCFGLALTTDEAQKLLRMAKTGELYARDRRDTILLYGLKEGLECASVNDMLDKNGMECIC